MRCWTSHRASASRTMGTFSSRPFWMISATVSCMSWSRPRPGPMTRECRFESMAMMGEAMVEAGAWVEPTSWVSRMVGWTIRLGE